MFERLREAIRRVLSGPAEKRLCCDARAFTIEVQCDRCGEVIAVRIDRDHEVQQEYAPDAEEGDHPIRWILRKEVVGKNCQNLVRFTIVFGPDQCLHSSTIDGGHFRLAELEAARSDSAVNSPEPRKA